MTRKEFVELAVVALADNAEAVEVGNKMIEALSKKHTNTGKPSARQIANEGIRERIAALLAESDEPMTTAMIINALEDESVASSQKVVSLVKGIPNVKKETVKGKVFYSLESEE